jgi:aminopeptidase N
MMPRRDVAVRRRGGRLPELTPVPTDTPAPDPTARLEEFAEEVAGAFRYMAEHFGPPPTETLMVSPIPGAFGQGFPGLLYLSTVSYLAPEDRPQNVRTAYQEYFYSEILHAHETAHQWWGNTVTTTAYQDAWLMEALANYSALMFLEQRKGPEALRTVLNQYRQHLLATNDDGETLESAGPISWGPRLDSSQASAYRIITYEKGSWIMHMLRRRLGDEAFLKMLGDLCKRYRFQSITTDDFRRHAAQYLPEGLPDPNLENFFDQWAFDVGIPELHLEHRARGNPPKVRVTGEVRQSNVPEYFSALVPVEIRLPDGKTFRRWLQTSEEAATFDVTLPAKPAAVILNPGESVLSR